MPAGWGPKWIDISQSYNAGIGGSAHSGTYLFGQVQSWPGLVGGSYPSMAVVNEKVSSVDHEVLWLLPRASQYQHFVLRGSGEGWVGHSCYLREWWSGTSIRFTRVVQGASSTYAGWQTHDKS